MKSYADILGASSPTARSGQRVAEIVAALAPPTRTEGDGDSAAPATTALVKVEPKHEPIGPMAMPLVPGIIGGAIGAVAWKKHRVLGFLAGHAIAANALPIARGYGDERKRALYQLGIESAGIGGAFLLKKHMNPALGWAVGILGGVAVTAFIPGSPANEGVKQIRANAKKPGGSWLDAIYPKG